MVVAAAATHTVDGGAGTADVLDLAGAGATLLTAATAAKFTNFETLSTTGGSGAFDVSLLSGITGLTEGVLGGAVTYNNVAAGVGLTITASPGAATTYNLANALGSSDSLNLTVSSAGIVDTGAVTANGIETIKLVSTDTDTTLHQNVVNISDNALTSLVITGTAGVALTAANTTITSVDASGLALTNTGAGAANTGFVWTSAAVTNDIVVKGSAAGGDAISLAAAATAGKTVTITEFAGTNTVIGSITLHNVITGGTGADTITGGSAADTIVGGGGADVITGGIGADIITVSGTTAKIVQAAGASGTNTATTIQTAELTATFDVINGLQAGDQIDLGNASIATAGLTLAGANLAAGLADTAVFASGTYDAAAGTFTYAANGHDTAVTYDSNVAAGVTAETIILVGYHAGATTTAAGGVLTLA